MWKLLVTCVIMLESASASKQKRSYDNQDPGRGPPAYKPTDPFDFHMQLTQQILEQHRAFSSAMATGLASAYASASNFQDFDTLIQQQIAEQHKFNQNANRNTISGPYGGTSSFASSLGNAGGVVSFAYTLPNNGSGDGSRPVADTSSYSSGYGPGPEGSPSTSNAPAFRPPAGPPVGPPARPLGPSGTDGSSTTSYTPNFAPGSHPDPSRTPTNDYATNYASATGSIGPEGKYQGANIYPENPYVPNINTRFSDDEDGNAGQKNGYRGVSVSSYSTSSDVNGQRTQERGASTTINDNGKVTTYRVHS